MTFIKPTLAQRRKWTIFPLSPFITLPSRVTTRQCYSETRCCFKTLVKAKPQDRSVLPFLFASVHPLCGQRRCRESPRRSLHRIYQPGSQPSSVL